MFFFPFGVWVLDETGVVVAFVAGDLFANKWWEFEGGFFAGEFNLGDDESVVGTVETVDFPFESLVVEFVACLLDDGLLTDAVEHVFGFIYWDRVFPFVA